MAKRWTEKVVGSLDQKKRYRRYKARTEQLPAGIRAANDALVRYMYRFGPGTGDDVLKMLEDLCDLFEQSVANGTPLSEVVGENPAEFAETFLQNYPEGQWIGRERNRLTNAIAFAAGDDPSTTRGQRN